MFHDRTDYVGKIFFINTRFSIGDPNNLNIVHSPTLYFQLSWVRLFGCFFNYLKNSYLFSIYVSLILKFHTTRNALLALVTNLKIFKVG